MEYSEDDMLMLSGIQHYAFCPRQWALIHIDQQWNENKLTAEGQIMHQHVDDPFYRQKVGDYICLRSVNLASKELGLYGISDVIELHPAENCLNAISHPKYPGYWIPYPIEYKHGKPKNNEIDQVQLAAQAICLEELYGIHIMEGAIFYGETRHRLNVLFSDDLRATVRSYAEGMHKLFSEGKIPSASLQPYCKNCSLKDICMPATTSPKSVTTYLNNNLYAETP